MKKILVLLLLFIVACGGSSEEIVVEDIETSNNIVEESSTTSLKQITTTTKLTTTTTTSTTTTLPPTTGVGLDDNGNEIYPAVQSIKITKPNVSNGESFSMKRWSQSEMDNRPLDILRGNEIEVVVSVVPGTNPIYEIFLQFGQPSINKHSVIGWCIHRVGNDRKNDIKPIYNPQEVVLFCGDFNNNSNTSNYDVVGSQEVGDVSLISVSVTDDYGNRTQYYSPDYILSGVYIPDGYINSLGEYGYSTSDDPSEEFINFFPTDVIFNITR